MKLSELIPHTAHSLGIPQTLVTSIAVALRAGGVLSSKGRGLGGAEMTLDDKVNLMLGACGVAVAKTAAESVKQWRRSVRLGQPDHATDFSFLRATNIRDLLVDLITKDLNGGPLERWLSESRINLGPPKNLILTNHELTVDFFVSEFSLDLHISRNFYNDKISINVPEKVSTDTMRVRFIPPPPNERRAKAKEKETHVVPSQLIRRLHEKNIIAWGACLSE